MEKISLCIICKDEEALIGNAIKSAKDFVDEIIVVDTGSTDRSIEIAKEYGAEVYSVDFNYNFSEIRNVAIEKSSCDWILFLDCDEELTKESGELLKRFLIENNNKHALFFRIVGLLNGDRRSANNDIRFFRNHKDIRFEGKVGEGVIKSIITNLGRDSISYSDLEIYHYGSDKEKVNLIEKADRNIGIYKRVGDKERTGEYYFKFGNEYGRKGNFKKALEMYNIALMKSEIEDWIEDMPRLILNKIKALHQLKVYEEEEMFIKKWEKVYKDFKDIYFMKTLLYRDKGDFKRAYDSFLVYEEKRQKPIYPSSEFQSFIDLNKFKEELFYLSQIVL